MGAPWKPHGSSWGAHGAPTRKAIGPSTVNYEAREPWDAPSTVNYEASRVTKSLDPRTVTRLRPPQAAGTTSRETNNTREAAGHVNTDKNGAQDIAGHAKNDKK